MDAIDWFSDLPEPIIHLIMSFLPTKYAARMSAVSKKFRSAWLSFPIINFDIKAFHQSEDLANLTIRQRKLFMVFIRNSLQRREPKTSIQKLSFRSVLTGFNFYDYLDWMIKYALHNNVQELDLDGDPESQRFYSDAGFCSLPKALFSAKSVRVLKVDGFKLEPQDLILSCPLLEDFRVRRCVEMKSIRVSSTHHLKAVEVGRCGGLQRIIIYAPNLETFSFNGVGEINDKEPQQCEIDFTACNSIRNLTLNLAGIPDQWFKDNLPNFTSLENLKLSDCPGLKDVCVSLPSIKEIELENCAGLEKIDIDGINLQSFLYSIEETRPCEINISACKCLRILSLNGATVTDVWIKDNMSAFSLLEAMKLSHCQMLKKIKFHHKLLKSLELIQCTKLEEAQIDTPKLLSFVYDGQVITPPVITSSNWDAKLKLRNNNFSDKCWFTNLREFFVGFDSCRLLTLVCGSDEELKFPTELREEMLAPLYDIKHVKIELGSNPINLKELMKSLLWLIPLPETISFVWGSKERSLKFQYDKSIANVEDQFCCWLRPIKCWSHSLKSVAMEDFEDNVVRENVKEFFVHNAIRLDTIYENSKGLFGSLEGEERGREGRRGE